MIMVDVNLLIYAFDTRSIHTKITRQWLDEQLNGDFIVGLPWESLLAFVRLTTNPRIFARPATLETAWNQVTAWLRSPVARTPTSTDRHAEVLAPLLKVTVGRPNLVPNAHLAALAIEHGLTLCSADAGFAQFPGLRWLNPITGREV